MLNTVRDSVQVENNRGAYRMPTQERDRHAWLRTALADRGHRQKDLAKAWGVDDAVASRFIKTGEPELTFDRAQSLAKMLDVGLDELKLRLAEGLAPVQRRGAPRAEQQAARDARDERAPSEIGSPAEAALDNLKSAVARVQATLPGTKVCATVTYGE